MVLILDAITAKCPACGHVDFRPPDAPLPLGSPLTCGHCGAEVHYGALQEQAERVQDSALGRR